METNCFESMSDDGVLETAVNLLAAHLSEENHAEVLGRARHRSKRDIEKLVAEIAPRPDVPSRVVTLPRPANGRVEHAPGPRGVWCAGRHK